MDKKMMMQLSKGYSLKFNYLSHLLDFVINLDNKLTLEVKNIPKILGCSEALAKNVRNFSIAFRLLKPKNYRITEFGKIIYINDKFFDKQETLWFLHYIITTNEKYVVWNRIINDVVYNEKIINVEIVKRYFADLGEYFSTYSIDNHLPTEIQAFLNFYIENKFKSLNIFEKSSEVNSYEVNNFIKIPSIVLLASIYYYRELFMKDSTSIGIIELVKSPNSPGKIFHISELYLRESLENLTRSNHISIESRANLDQVRLKSDVIWTDIVKQFYRQAENE